jgi:hypothetical protein
MAAKQQPLTSTSLPFRTNLSLAGVRVEYRVDAGAGASLRLTADLLFAEAGLKIAPRSSFLRGGRRRPDAVA